MTDQSQAQIEAEIARTRAELQATVDELSDRLNPKNQARHVVDEAKIAATDVKRRVTGELSGVGEPEPTKTGWIALGAGAAAVVAVVASVIRKR